MYRHPSILRFYASSKWINLRLLLINERGNKCGKCGKYIAQSKLLHGHHKIELTPENINDAMVSLNPDMIEIICQRCHNAEHNRFTSIADRGVYIVYGMPLSGKTSFVTENKGRHDIVIDIDKLYEAITLLPSHDKPDSLLPNVKAIYNQLIDQVKVRYGRWQSAWIIGGFPEKYKREKLAADLGAELIYMDATKDECIARLEMDEDRQYRVDEYKHYIDKWCERYTS